MPIAQWEGQALVFNNGVKDVLQNGVSVVDENKVAHITTSSEGNVEIDNLTIIKNAEQELEVPFDNDTIYRDPNDGFIKARGGGGGTSEGDVIEIVTPLLAGKQDLLTAGDGIGLVNNNISVDTYTLANDSGFASELANNGDFTNNLLDNSGFTYDLANSSYFTDDLLNNFSFTHDLANNSYFTSDLVDNGNFTDQMTREFVDKIYWGNGLKVDNSYPSGSNYSYAISANLTAGAGVDITNGSNNDLVISDIRPVPAYTAADVGKVLGVKLSEGTPVLTANNISLEESASSGFVEGNLDYCNLNPLTPEENYTIEFTFDNQSYTEVFYAEPVGDGRVMLLEYGMDGTYPGTFQGGIQIPRFGSIIIETADVTSTHTFSVDFRVNQTPQLAWVTP